MNKKLLSGAVASAILAWPVAVFAQQPATLPAVKVEGQANAEITPSTPVEGYKASTSFSANKTGTPLAETQQAVTVITREQMRDQGVTTVQDALRYSAGVSSDTYGYDNRGDWAFVRGTSYVQFQDGLKNLFGFYNNIRPEPFLLERIEVIKGPSSVLYGQGGFGGLVNLVTKRPQRETAREIEVQLGEYGRAQLGIDLTGSINDDGTLMARLIGVHRESNSQVDFVPDDRSLIAPSLTWAPNSDTNLTIYAIQQRDLSGSSVGFFPIVGTRFESPNGRIPNNTFISEPGFDKYLAQQTSYGAEFNQRLNDTFSFSQKIRQSDSSVSYNSAYALFPRPRLNADGRTINRTIIAQLNLADTLVSDTQLTAKWSSPRWEHTSILGVDYQRAVQGGARDRRDGVVGAIDVFNPSYGNFTAPTLADIPGTVQRQTGVYGQHQFKYDKRWLGTVGVRRDLAKSDTDGSTASDYDQSQNSYRFSLGYITNAGAMPYFSYSESFLPVAGLNSNGLPFQPQTADQVEAGIKYETPDGKSLFTASVFEITETNRRSSSTQGGVTTTTQLGEAQSKGLELEANHQWSPSVDMVASYSYISAKVTKDQGGSEGKRLASVPKQLLSVWGRQKFEWMGTTGWQWGAGLRFVDESWDGADNVRTPSVTLLDAMLSYTAGDWRYAVNATNLANREYVSTCLARGDCFYGTARNVLFTANYRF
ncbi:MAG TPA: TonB-dependent siderophore receptor [Limnobacter sp.]|nr:TonB-dependent siderophore receptor [Limnobacter sp.]